MSKVTLDDLDNLENDPSATYKLNSNFTKIEQGFDDTLSRTGKTPNTMAANLDMNGNRVLNLPKPINPTEPLRLNELNNFTFDLDERVRLAQVARDGAEAARDNAIAKASEAAGSAAAASTSAADAATSKTGADTAKTGAETAKTAAETAKAQAQGFAQNANDLANTPANTDVPGYPTGTRSAKHWASVAQAVAGGVTATGTTFTPYGSIASTNVQGAIQELEDDKSLYGKLANANTWINSQTLDTSALFLTSAAGNVARQIVWQTGTSKRWQLGIELGVESGSNAGGDLTLQRYSDAGSAIGSPIRFTRSTGVVSFPATPTSPSPAAADNSTKGATTGYVQGELGNYMPKSGGTFTGNINGTTAGFTTSISAPTVTATGALATQNSTINFGLLGDYLKFDGTNFNTSKGTLWHTGNFNPASYQPAGNYVSQGGYFSASSIDSVGNISCTGTDNQIKTTDGYMYASRSGNSPLYVRRTGNTGTLVIFRYSSADTTVGSISCTGSTTSYNTSSDARLKENVMPSLPVGDIIDDIEVVDYNWKEDGKYDKGVIAQQVKEVYPLVVKEPEADHEYYQVDYSKFVPLLLKEVQDLRKRVAELENK